MVEDTPIPEEVNCILFVVTANGEYKSVQMLGYEERVDLSKIAFNPLEAEFVFLHDFAKKESAQFEYNLKLLIEESFCANTLKKEFKNKKIYYMYKNKIMFLFKV